MDRKGKKQKEREGGGKGGLEGVPLEKRGTCVIPLTTKVLPKTGRGREKKKLRRKIKIMEFCKWHMAP